MNYVCTVQCARVHVLIIHIYALILVKLHIYDEEDNDDEKLVNL